MNLTCVLIARDHLSALRAKEILEQEGIMVMMSNEYIAGIMPHYTNATGGLKIYVKDKWAVRADEILEPFRGDLALERKQELPSCPECHSCDVKWSLTLKDRLAQLISVFISAPVPPKYVFKKCKDCGHRWV